jgi:acyl-coenzyme A thioesterase PaaI-like protein
MTVPNSAPIEQANDRCFACGSRNTHGLRLCFATDGDHAVTTVWRTDEVWEGYRGVIHGGIVSTVLDEAMSKAVVAAGIRAFTCELRVRLRERVQVAEELRVRGWVVEKRKRRIAAEASLRDPNGTERAHAWATFLELQQCDSGR